MSTALLLSADRWGMTDEKTGKPMTGVSLWFVNDYREDGEESLGFKPTKIGAPSELWATLRSMKLPAICELIYTPRPGAGGKASIALTGVKFVREADVFALPTSGIKK